MDLLALKTHIIKKVEDAYASKEPFAEIKLQIIDLFEHIKYLNGGPICYIKEKGSETEKLAHGAFLMTDDIHSVNLSKSELLFGAEKFPSKLEGKKNGYFFKPILVYSKSKKGYDTQLTVHIDYLQVHNKKTLTKFIIYLSELLTFNNNEPDKMPVLNDVLEVPEIDEWKSKVQKVIKNIDSKQKVVLSRQKIFSYDEKITDSCILQKIPRSPDQYLFFLKISKSEFFISVSPEKLFSLTNNKISIDCIAGTRKRSKNSELDKKLEQELINSEKERSEHLFVANFIEEKMYKFCNKIVMTRAFDIMKLSKVQHLFSEFVGDLKTNENYKTILSHLFPTPAVAGTPSNFAIEQIQKLEPNKRNYYAGACGYVSEHSTELLVGIRSIYVKENKIFVYGGAGIVADSDYKKEWTETEEKMKNFSFLWEQS